MTSLRSTPRVSTAASTVSIAVPVKRSLVGARSVLVGDLEGDVEAAAARVEAARDRLQVAGVGGFELHVRTSRSKVTARLAASPRPLRALAARARSRSRCPCSSSVRASRVTEISLMSAGVDADHLMRAQRGEHLRGRQRAGGAEVGRADRSRSARRSRRCRRGRRSARRRRDRDAGAQHRRRDASSRLCAERPRRVAASRAERERASDADHRHLPQRNRLAVDCSIWSAALMTLAFIS